MEDRFQVGVITSTHGIKGEVKVFPESLGLDCLQLKIIHMPKWHILG